MPLRARVRRRTRWQNHTGNQGVDPLEIVRPTTLAELVELVQRAERDGVTVRAVGSGHSWSDVALTTGFLVETHGLDRCPPGPPPHLREGVDGERLVWTEAGIPLHKLNPLLHERGLALSNMGGYDAQTVAGVLATSTHGSGIAFGPIADAVRSLDLVAVGGAVYRIEPADGPTDPAAFAAAHPERELVQDDDAFHAVVVSMGCMGIVYGVMLAVEPAYCLREVRTLTTWAAVKRDLLDPQRTVLGAHRHYEVLVSPYPDKDGQHTCLVTTRDPVRCRRRGAIRTRSRLVELTSAFPLTSSILNLILGVWPRIAPRLIDAQMKAIARKDYENVSYKVLNIGHANLLRAYSSEIGVPFEGDTHVHAVERVFEVAAQRRRLGAAFHSSAFSLRFVKGSPAFASMMHGRDTMMIELILLTHTEGGMELLAAHEEALYALGGRPHWGQVNTLTGSHELVASMYPRWADWLAAHARFNASGVFDAPFAKRVGIATARFAAGTADDAGRADALR
ncbi:MAG: FAD-binding protein [Actinobacteria bacterium]|nr:FAD-binding protein [Actinomycetota bacterium]